MRGKRHAWTWEIVKAEDGDVRSFQTTTPCIFHFVFVSWQFQFHVWPSGQVKTLHVLPIVNETNPFSFSPFLFCPYYFDSHALFSENIYINRNQKKIERLDFFFLTYLLWELILFETLSDTKCEYLFPRIFEHEFITL